MKNNKVIYKCAVNGVVGTQVYKRKVLTTICGESICVVVSQFVAQKNHVNMVTNMRKIPPKTN